MRSGRGRRGWAAVFLFTCWAALPGTAAVVHDLPSAPSALPAPTADPSVVGLPGDPGLPAGPAVVDHLDNPFRSPRAAAQTPAGVPAPNLVAPPAEPTLDARTGPAAGKPAGPGASTVVPVAPDEQFGPAPELVTVAPVPEPSTGLLLAAAGLAALGRRGRRRTRGGSRR